MDQKEEKSLLRKEISARSLGLPPEYLRQSTAAICRRLLALEEYQRAGTVFCFVSMPQEINTLPILLHALGAGKGLAVPRCISGGMLEARLITSLEELTPGRWGILEPGEASPLVPREELDFAVVPCLSCDPLGRRLGHGGGYYDRYLAGAALPAALLCRERLLLPAVPTEPHDVRVPLVVTEDRVLGPGVPEPR